MIHIDGCRTPARIQAVRGRIARTRPVSFPWYRKLWNTLNQKGDPTLEIIKCAYCDKSIEQGKEVKNVLLYLNGSQLAQKEKEYCSKQCAEYDQMAHES